MSTDGKEDDPRIDRAATGDAGALEELLRELEPRLRASLMIQPRWQGALDSEDVLQVTFLEAFLECCDAILHCEEHDLDVDAVGVLINILR